MCLFLCFVTYLYKCFVTYLEHEKKIKKKEKKQTKTKGTDIREWGVKSEWTKEAKQMEMGSRWNDGVYVGFVR